MVRPGNIGQIVAEILGAAGRTARQPAAALLIDLERHNKLALFNAAGVVQDAGYLMLLGFPPCIMMTARILLLSYHSANWGRAPIS